MCCASNDVTCWPHQGSGCPQCSTKQCHGKHHPISASAGGACSCCVLYTVEHCVCLGYGSSLVLLVRTFTSSINFVLHLMYPTAADTHAP
jgi:hypothetical protein